MASKASSTRSQSLRVQESDKTSTGSSKTKSTAAKGKENLKNPEKVSEKKNKIEKAPEVAGRPKREIKKTEKAKLLELEKIETKKGRKSTILSTDVEDSLSGEAESRKDNLYSWKYRKKLYLSSSWGCPSLCMLYLKKKDQTVPTLTVDFN